MQKMTTRTLMIVSASLLLVSLGAVFAAFTPPTEVEGETTLLNYEHRGKFDYRAYQKVSYLFDDILLETSPETEETPEIPEITEIPESPPSAPKYPIEITDAFI